MDQQLLAQQIRLCQQGQAHAFSWMVREFGPRLYRYFFRTCGSESEAEDLVQELFVKLLEKIGGYEHQGRFEHWLFRVAANLNRDRLRQKQRVGQAMPMRQNSEDWSLVNTLPAEEPDPMEQLTKVEQVLNLQQALTQLPEMDREIIMLRHYSGMSFRELAEHFQIPTGTALAKVHRGLKKLRKLMGDEDE